MDSHLTCFSHTSSPSWWCGGPSTTASICITQHSASQTRWICMVFSFRTFSIDKYLFLFFWMIHIAFLILVLYAAFTTSYAPLFIWTCNKFTFQTRLTLPHTITTDGLHTHTIAFLLALCTHRFLFISNLHFCQCHKIKKIFSVLLVHACLHILNVFTYHLPEGISPRGDTGRKPADPVYAVEKVTGSF